MASSSSWRDRPVRNADPADGGPPALSGSSHLALHAVDALQLHIPDILPCEGHALTGISGHSARLPASSPPGTGRAVCPLDCGSPLLLPARRFPLLSDSGRALRGTGVPSSSRMVSVCSLTSLLSVRRTASPGSRTILALQVQAAIRQNLRISDQTRPSFTGDTFPVHAFSSAISAPLSGIPDSQDALQRPPSHSVSSDCSGYAPLMGKQSPQSLHSPVRQGPLTPLPASTASTRLCALQRSSAPLSFSPELGGTIPPLPIRRACHRKLRIDLLLSPSPSSARIAGAAMDLSLPLPRHPKQRP